MVCGVLTALALCNALAFDNRYDPTAITVQELVTKARAAAGHLKPGGYRIVDTTTGDGTSGTTETLELNDDYVTVVHDGPFTTSYGESAGTEWSSNANGIVVVSPNDDTVTANPYAVMLDAIGSTTDGFTILGVTKDEPRCVVLELKPRKGLIERRFYDAQSFLLRRVETDDFQGTSQAQYDDYRRTFGRMISYRRTYTDAHNPTPFEIRISSFEPAKTSAASFAIPKSAVVFDLGGSSQQQIPADFTSEGIIVRVTIAGRGLDFLVDSGAATTVIDSRVARELGLQLYGTRKGEYGGEVTQARTRVDDFELGSIHARHFALSAIPLSLEANDKRVVGLLGSDFFSSARIRVGFKNKTLTMESAATAVPNGWTKVAMNVDDDVPMTKASFNGVDGHFILDLGAFETMLYPHYFSKFKPNSIGDTVGDVLTVGGKATPYREYTFSRFDLGDLAFSDMQVIVAEGNTIEGITYDGLIGRSFLSNFDVLFDYPNRAAYLSPQLY